MDGVTDPAQMVDKQNGCAPRRRTPHKRSAEPEWGGGNVRPRIDVRLTVKRLTRAARARVPKPARHAECPHLKRAMQAA